jgi:hypothetical protein
MRNTRSAFAVGIIGLLSPFPWLQWILAPSRRALPLPQGHRANTDVVGESVDEFAVLRGLACNRQHSVTTMRRAWPPVYRPPSAQQNVVSSAVAAVPQQTTTTPTAAAPRYRRETAPAGTCFVIAAPCSCSAPPRSTAGPLTVRNHQQHLHQHRGPPPPLPARNGAGCPYRCCASGRPQNPSGPAQTRHNLQPYQQYQYQQHYVEQQRRCAYVRPRPSRSLENLLRVVELDDAATAVVGGAGHRGVYEKSCHYGNPRRKMKVSGKENRHAWKRRSMESLLSARDAAVFSKNFEFFRHVSQPTALLVYFYLQTFSFLSSLPHCTLTSKCCRVSPPAESRFKNGTQHYYS